MYLFNRIKPHTPPQKDYKDKNYTHAQQNATRLYNPNIAIIFLILYFLCFM